MPGFSGNSTISYPSSSHLLAEVSPMQATGICLAPGTCSVHTFTALGDANVTTDVALAASAVASVQAAGTVSHELLSRPEWSSQLAWRPDTAPCCSPSAAARPRAPSPGLWTAESLQPGLEIPKSLQSRHRQQPNAAVELPPERRNPSPAASAALLRPQETSPPRSRSSARGGGPAQPLPMLARSAQCTGAPRRPDLAATRAVYSAACRSCPARA
eukprot:scaffold13_cov241-Pinguiococcus_pyrenoidosus.AAC.12